MPILQKDEKIRESFNKFWKTVRGYSPRAAVLMTVNELEDWSFIVWRESRKSLLDEITFRKPKKKSKPLNMKSHIFANLENSATGVTSKGSYHGNG